MALISEKEYRDLETIRAIRNEFAHNHRTTFTDRKIIELCRHLNLSAQDYDDVVVDPRGQFTTAAVALIMNFVNRPHYVSEKRLKYEEWPY